MENVQVKRKCNREGKNKTKQKPENIYFTCANSHTKWLCGESMRGSTPIISLVWSEASDCGTRPSDHLRPSMRYVSYSTPSCDIRTGLTLTRTSLFFDLW